MKSKKIIYGIAAEGMGHAIRSSVIIDFLISEGHDVHIVSSGRAAEFLTKKFPNVLSAYGLTLSYKNNQVDKVNTVINNLKASKNLIKNTELISNKFKKFKPDLVITDFDSSVNTFAKINNIPCIAIDNIQIINRCKLDKELKNTNFTIAKNIVKFKTPWCKAYLVTSFFDAKLKKKKTKIFHPIIRKEIIETKVETDNTNPFILVYQTSESNPELLEHLKKSKFNFVIYGVKRNLTNDQVDGNLTYKPFSEASFISDMAKSTAIVTGGGFTVISEALFMRKPIYCLPIKNQFEQEMNAYYLEKLGYGKYCKDVQNFNVQSFIDNLAFYKDNLADYKHDNNRKIFKFIKKLIS